jgi:3-oxoacyl-(acyl-carrier-protein) synthase
MPLSTEAHGWAHPDRHAGNKAKSLYRLGAHGLPVPPWAILGSDVFAEFRREAGLDAKIAEHLQALETHPAEDIARRERREGFVPSEGAGALVLETLAGARRRGARIHAEVLGAAAAADASRLPKPDLGGQVRAIQAALQDARVAPEQIDYVDAHATSTPLGDAVEVAAIKAALGARAYQVPVNSTKSMIGHCLTSAGIVELVATILQVENHTVHPTINQEEPDPALGLDFVPNVSRPHRIEFAISNAFGFGGLNSCVVVGRVP